MLRNSKRVRLGGIVGAAAVALTVSALALPANAATTGFATQARSAGLTAVQARTMQAEVDRYVAQTGGVQVSANRVDFDGGDVVVAIPGQSYTHDLATGVQPAAYASCGSGDFCAYSGAGGTGTKRAYYKCQDVVPFTSGQGSVSNNQTGGAQAKLYRYKSSGVSYLALTLSPPNNASWSWTGTADIRTC